MPADRIRYLLEQYLTDRASTQEQQELASIVKQPDNETLLKDNLELLIDQFQSPEFDMQRLDAMVKNVLGADIGSYSPKVPSMFNWRRWAVAASLILVVGLGSYFVFKNSVKQEQVVKAESVMDVQAPVVVRAMITLSDGSQVMLDSLPNGLLAEQGNVNLVKMANGQIAYETTSEQELQMRFNTLTNPRGSRVVHLSLSDGTKVWLDAESSLRYPTTFTGSSRIVELDGQGYFEVAEDTEKPFHVKSVSQEVTVLGTHFNISSYQNESIVKTTLLEGSVKVTVGDATKFLTPGQETQLSKNGNMRLIKNADTELALAWKNGQFNFQSSSLETIMNQLVRWYDVEVIYEGNQSIKLSGYVSRDVALTHVLKLLQSNGVKLRKEGKKIIVM